ncbi:MAG: c-type cytochrome precursor [Gemmataceae bacterium]|nr:c-type cytochrome precursor [Gemmataceae bacterium]
MAEHDPHTLPPRPAHPRRLPWIVWVAVGLGLAAAGLAASSWWTTPAPPPPPAVDSDDETDEPVVVQNPGYLGPQACAPCHPQRAAEFSSTTHFRACRRPTDGPMPAGFAPGMGRYPTRDPDLRFEMTQVGGEFFQTAVQATPAGDRRATARIDLVYGANKADEVFFTWRGDSLSELMTVWVHPWNRWAHTSYDRHGGGDFTRTTTPRCLECHNTWFEHVPGSVNRYRPDTLILGVSCERCHGPGRDHADFHRAHPGARPGHAVVNPGRLPRDRLMEVCTQCHGNVTKYRDRPFSYRPGELLETYYRTAVTKHPEEDHVANQGKYLRQSKCFQKSDTLTCVSCHDPHRPHAPGAVAAKACLTCHQPAACTDRPRLPAAVRDDCVACHMPQRVWMNVHFHTADDQYVPPIRRYQHRIGIHPTARSEVLLAWHRTQSGDGSRAAADRLAGELAGHWLAEAETCRREYRFLAAIGAAREALRLDPPPAAREKALAALRTAIGTQAKLDADLVEALREANARRAGPAADILERILTVKPDLAVAHSKLGTLYAQGGQTDRAVEHLAAVARHDPDNASGLAMLGWLAYLEDRPADAADAYRRAEQIEPFDAKINYHWGLSLIKLGRWPDAATRFRRALTIDPGHAGGYQGLSHALREDGHADEAVQYGRRAARLTEFQQPDVLVTLAEAYAGAGRAAEAGAVAAKALDLDSAQPGGPALTPQMRRRMEDRRGADGLAPRR